MSIEPLVRSVFGDFVLVELLGRGSNSLVYRADHPSFGRDIALKIVDVTDEPRLEVAAAVSKVAPPGVVSVYGHGRVDKHAWSAMRLITGVDLQAWMAHTRLALSDVTSILRQVAATLDALHAAGLVHGDVPKHSRRDSLRAPRQVAYLPDRPGTRGLQIPDARLRSTRTNPRILGDAVNRSILAGNACIRVPRRRPSFPRRHATHNDVCAPGLADSVDDGVEVHLRSHSCGRARCCIRCGTFAQPSRQVCIVFRTRRGRRISHQGLWRRRSSGGRPSPIK